MPRFVPTAQGGFLRMPYAITTPVGNNEMHQRTSNFNRTRPPPSASSGPTSSQIAAVAAASAASAVAALVNQQRLQQRVPPPTVPPATPRPNVARTLQQQRSAAQPRAALPPASPLSPSQNDARGRRSLGPLRAKLPLPPSRPNVSFVEPATSTYSAPRVQSVADVLQPDALGAMKQALNGRVGSVAVL